MDMNEQIPERRVIDKSAWPDGPWKAEPDRVDWTHAGYACLLLRNENSGTWCGYVGVDRENPLYGRDYSDAPHLDVHGGLTYSDACRPEWGICHVPAAGMPEDVWWLGFDAAHLVDFSPGEFATIFASRNEKSYRTLEYARNETESLAEQLRSLAHQPEQ
jgi:hypothetical protein